METPRNCLMPSKLQIQRQLNSIRIYKEASYGSDKIRTGLVFNMLGMIKTPPERGLLSASHG